MLSIVIAGCFGHRLVLGPWNPSSHTQTKLSLIDFPLCVYLKSLKNLHRPSSALASLLKWKINHNKTFIPTMIFKMKNVWFIGVPFRISIILYVSKINLTSGFQKFRTIDKAVALTVVLVQLSPRFPQYIYPYLSLAFRIPARFSRLNTESCAIKP